MHLFFALAQLALAVVLLVGIWCALPARWWPVDVGGSALAGAWMVAAVGLARGAAWGQRWSRALALGTVGLGLGLVAALASSVAALAGMYGPVGAGGALLLAAVALLLLPYLVGLPLLCWWGLGRLPKDASRA